MAVQVEDRPVVKEIKTYVREHHPVEKEFVVETRPTGLPILSHDYWSKHLQLFLPYFE